MPANWIEICLSVPRDEAEAAEAALAAHDGDHGAAAEAHHRRRLATADLRSGGAGQQCVVSGLPGGGEALLLGADAHPRDAGGDAVGDDEGVGSRRGHFFEIGEAMNVRYDFPLQAGLVPGDHVRIGGDIAVRTVGGGGLAHEGFVSDRQKIGDQRIDEFLRVVNRPVARQARERGGEPAGEVGLQPGPVEVGGGDAVNLGRPGGATGGDQGRPLAEAAAPAKPTMGDIHVEGAGEQLDQEVYDSLIAEQMWPQSDESALERDSIELVVQVNGKLRSKISVPADADNDAVEAIALKDEKIQLNIQDKTVRKVIVVPGRLVNLVVA